MSGDRDPCWRGSGGEKKRQTADRRERGAPDSACFKITRAAGNPRPAGAGAGAGARSGAPGAGGGALGSSPARR